MHGFIRAALDLIFPRSCIHCGNPVENSPYDFICSECANEIIECLPPACKTCGYPFYGMIIAEKSCPHCIDLEPLFDEGKALFLAKGAGRSLLHELKYQQRPYVLKDLFRMINDSAHYLKYIRNASFVPVPLHPVKLRERGFNQSEQIAKVLTLATKGSSQIENLLVRKQYTRSQTRLNQTERYQNVKNAFALAPNTVLTQSKNYILVDDVFTTGSTLNACAHVLRKAGAIHLKVATIGHG